MTADRRAQVVAGSSLRRSRRDRRRQQTHSPKASTDFAGPCTWSRSHAIGVGIVPATPCRVKIISAIHWQALREWNKGAKIVERPQVATIAPALVRGDNIRIERRSN
jgi:hypothetical protein